MSFLVSRQMIKIRSEFVMGYVIGFIALFLIVFAFTIFILLLDMVFKGFFNLIKLG